MINTGIIKKIDKDEITIHFYKDSACAHCSACSPDKKMGTTIKIHVEDTTKYVLEQEISVELDDSTLLKFSFITYIIPAILMILGYLILDFFKFSEIVSIIGSFAFLIFSFIGLFFYDRSRTKDVGDAIRIID